MGVRPIDATERTLHRSFGLPTACFDEIDAPTDVITGLVPVISINKTRGYAKRVLAKRSALRIGMAGTSPAMTILCERKSL
jgi:hypothetical protein